MALVKDWDELRDDVAGDWYFTPDGKHIVLKIGTTHGNVLIIPINNSDETPSWHWDGSRESPTLTPSIRVLPNGWHGYLRAGKLETA